MRQQKNAVAAGRLDLARHVAGNPRAVAASGNNRRIAGYGAGGLHNLNHLAGRQREQLTSAAGNDQAGNGVR